MRKRTESSATKNIEAAEKDFAMHKKLAAAIGKHNPFGPRAAVERFWKVAKVPKRARNK